MSYENLVEEDAFLVLMSVRSLHHHPLEARPLEHGLAIRKVAPLCQINNDSDRSALY